MKDFKNIKLLVCDCDGVLTDGRIIYDSHSAEIKNFSSHDGVGIMILKHTEIQIAIITGRISKTLERRCKDLGITLLFQGILNKKQCLSSLLEELDLSFDNAAYIGDDMNDYLAMEACHVKIAPNNAREAIKNIADYVTELSGGFGAVREAIEYILAQRNELDTAVSLYLKETL